MLRKHVPKPPKPKSTHYLYIQRTNGYAPNSTDQDDRDQPVSNLMTQLSESPTKSLNHATLGTFTLAKKTATSDQDHDATYFGTLTTKGSDHLRYWLCYPKNLNVTPYSVYKTVYMHKENITSETLASQESKSIDECVTKEVGVNNPYINVVAVLRKDLVQVQEYYREAMVLTDEVMKSYNIDKMKTYHHLKTLHRFLEHRIPLDIDKIHMTFELIIYISRRASFMNKTWSHVERMVLLLVEKHDDASKITTTEYQEDLKIFLDLRQKQMGELIDIIGRDHVVQSCLPDRPDIKKSLERILMYK